MKDKASDAADYAYDTAESVKDSAVDAANKVSEVVQTYLTWGEAKAKESKDSTAKSIQVHMHLAWTLRILRAWKLKSIQLFRYMEAFTLTIWLR